MIDRHIGLRGSLAEFSQGLGQVPDELRRRRANDRRIGAAAITRAVHRRALLLAALTIDQAPTPSTAAATRHSAAGMKFA